MAEVIKSEGSENEKAGLYEKELERAKNNWGKLFDEFQDPQERIEVLLSRMEWIFEINVVDGKKILENLQGLSEENDRQEFINKIVEALSPILELSKKNPEVFEEAQRKFVQEKGGNVVNEVFYYDMHEGGVEIHVFPAKSLGPAKIKKKFLEGLRELANVIEKDSSLTTIKAVSWIIFEKPALVELLGFTVTGMNEEQREGNAEISREEFLKRYLK